MEAVDGRNGSYADASAISNYQVRIGVGKIIVASGESERIVVSRESDSGPLPRSSVSCVIRSEP